MKIKLIIALLSIIVGHTLVPNFKSITLNATFVNAEGDKKTCTFSWGGIGFGKSLSDGKFDECIGEKKKSGYSMTSNEKIEIDQSLINWLIFG